MQKVILKFLVSIFFCLAFFTVSIADSFDNELVTADSLYSTKLYTESIKIYESIFEAGKATPAMLLKMARIEEGLMNYGQTIFYLEKYFELTEDKKVLRHIEQIAEKEKLSGYSYNFGFYFSHYYQKWQPLLLAVLLAILIILLSFMIKNRDKQFLKRQYFSFAVILIVLIGVANNIVFPHYAIVVDHPTFLLQGPSAASNVVQRIDKNHKIVVKDQVDVWTETEWQDNKAYIKTDHLKKL
ncbi:hypothetical protein GCM10011506_34670 [Marivirga lumbricoides]|uniref:SH3b domain-containing protein n=1 Tax=Marivirga lumbricoides TaxID=1046115 RepID=A0A2T4DVT8_9BACT|nr:hypothetical protein C9994_00745 [Marivirga lumbricoides]GGC46110.1 hypothetical protein GCM10011506_34670 [Marivirga lumbricoides]